MADLLSTWKSAKKVYEDKTMEKKPSKTFLGIRAGSGIEGPLGVVDRVKDAEAVAKAIALVKKAAIAFEKLVLIRIVEERGAPNAAVIKSEGQKLLKVLEKLLADMAAKGDQVLEAAITARNDQIEKDWTLKKMLGDANKLKGFRAYCAKEMNLENLEFIAAVKKRMAPPDIYDKFIKRNAPMEINLPNGVLGKILNDGKTGLKPKADLGVALEAAEDNLADPAYRYRNQMIVDYRKDLTAKYRKLAG